MRLPSGSAETLLREVQKEGLTFSYLGCVSFEDRCRGFLERHLLPERSAFGPAKMITVREVDDAFPDYRATLRRKRAQHSKAILRSGSIECDLSIDLLASEDELLDLADHLKATLGASVIVDISCFPRRVFCFLLKQILLDSRFENVLVAYTGAGPQGYASGHLAEDPLPCDYLPGFAGNPLATADTIALACGFESLGLGSFIDLSREGVRHIRIAMAFPPNGSNTRRQWNTVRQLVQGRSMLLDGSDIVALGAWDAEEMYITLVRWASDSDGVALAPFGTKPHSLGMLLFALAVDAPMYYCQPRSYNPDYTRGTGESRLYLPKWQGVVCWERPRAAL